MKSASRPAIRATSAVSHGMRVTIPSGSLSISTWCSSSAALARNRRTARSGGSGSSAMSDLLSVDLLDDLGQVLGVDQEVEERLGHVSRVDIRVDAHL